MNNDDNLDLLDLNDDADSMDTLPEATPLSAPRPKKPWLLMAVGLLVIILATYVIIRIVGGDSASTMEVDLDAPAVIVEGADPNAPLVVGDVAPQPANVAQVPVVQPAPQPQPAPVAQQPAAKPVQQQAAPKPAVENATPGVPVRVIEDRKEVTFNPNKEPAKPAQVKAATKPAAQQQQTARRTTTAAQQTQKRAQTTPKAYAWYAQIGSYSTRALAEAGQRKLQAAHQSLFSGHQFVILAAVLPNGTTTYRLRVGFNASGDANNFCRNAKADGLECYVTK